MTYFGAYEPAGLMYLARGIANGDLEWNETLARVLFACTLCGYCEDLCQRGYRHVPAITILEELRRIIPSQLKPQALKSAAETLTVPAAHKLAVLQKYGLFDVTGSRKASTILFADNSLLANDSKLSEIGYIIKQSGKKIGCFVSNPLPPVSAALLNGGCQAELEKAVAKIDECLTRHAVKQAIVYNPESLSVLKRFSRSGVEFVSILKLCAEMLKKKKPKRIKLPLVTYQDPCHLGRYAKEYAAPREVIARLGLSFKEMWRSGNNSLCCGAGGGVLATDQAKAKEYAANRWQEAKATGAKVMLTACPYCFANLQRTKPRNLKVVDLVTLVAQAYGFRGKEARR
jgi:Fe-S oxidoreductase